MNVRRDDTSVQVKVRSTADGSLKPAWVIGNIVLCAAGTVGLGGAVVVCPVRRDCGNLVTRIADRLREEGYRDVIVDESFLPPPPPFVDVGAGI